MLHYLLIGVTLSIGQPGTAPAGNLAALEPAPPPVRPVLFQVVEPVPPEPPLEEEKPVVEPAEQPPPPPAPPDRWLLMRCLQGTWPGYLLDGHRMQLYGWVEGSYNASSVAQNNSPVVWTDRANEFLMQQAWVRFERPVVTSGTTLPTWGFRSDWLYGTDYRFTLPRGLWNSQLANADGAQNLYGVDPISHYVNVYFPTLFQGTEFRVGRHYCPFGVESLEAINTPLMTRSYAFNFSPPFTHYGLMLLSNLTPQWQVNLMLVNGNDVMIGDPSEEMRFVGKLTWIAPNKRDTVSFGTSVGRGKFNAGEPNFYATAGLANEPAGRNNINVFDLVWTHTINPRLSYAFETIYGYQTNVPANVPGGIIKLDSTEGTAHWWSFVNYLFYTLSPQWTATARAEFFWDFEGQRTGFEGPYQAVTLGLAYKTRLFTTDRSLWFRPEVRYDHNGYSRPFEGKHAIFFAGADCIIRW
ncbi:MAG TPA: outer membrane beta-barrel protein [Gemmataceae bacterium]|nr:outer membrane beta-barrel protein [Gemmataceae bacterium]